MVTQKTQQIKFKREVYALCREAKQNTKVIWIESYNKAFEQIKTILTNLPLLSHFKEDRNTGVYTDASNIRIGAVLTQIEPMNNQELPIVCLSRKLKPHETRYFTIEKEMSGLVYTIAYGKEYLLGRKITFFTDNSALQYFQTFKNPSNRLGRLATKLVDYDLDIKYKKKVRQWIF